MKGDRYRGRVISVEGFLDTIKPGSRLFLSSEPASPLYTINALINSNRMNLMDLEIVQLMTMGSFLSTDSCERLHFRLKTFHFGESLSREICYGTFDYIPAGILDIPRIFARNILDIDIAVIGVSPPDEKGRMSPGIAVDVASLAAAKAKIVVAEVNPNMPFTSTDALISIDDVDYFIESNRPLPERPTRAYDETSDRIGWNISNLVDDGSTVVMHVGSIFDALAVHLKQKKGLAILTTMVSDWVIDLIEGGVLASGNGTDDDCAVITNSCYGTRRLYDYVHNNARIRFVPLDFLHRMLRVERVKPMVSVLNVEKTDITCNTVQFHARDNILSGYASKFLFAQMATQFGEGKALCALRSVDREGKSAIVMTLEGETERVRSTMGVVHYVVTEYGVASLFGKSVRERAMALIDIAHPSHRDDLLARAKEEGLVHGDQIYVTRNVVNYPAFLETVEVFAKNVEVKFRPIKPTDEDMLRRQFYTLSGNSRYLRYFTAIRLMPHKNIQKYVNIDYEKTLCIVGIVNKGGGEHIIAEGRYSYNEDDKTHEMGIVVSEDFQGMGIASFLVNYLLKIAAERGIKKLSALVLHENKAMIRVFERADVLPMKHGADGIIEFIFELP
jgi:acyl-CoA hydrolase